MVHICGPGLNAIHHPAPDLLPDLVKVDDVGCARCHQMLPIVRNQIAQTLPPFFDRERTNAEIGQVAPGTTTPRQLPIEPKPLTIRQRSEEHTSELQSLMRISYAVFCLKKQNTKHNKNMYHMILTSNKKSHLIKKQ